MKALKIWEQVTDHYYELKNENGTLILEKTEFSGDLPLGLLAEIKGHKNEILEFLHFQEEADLLLLQSSERLAYEWPQSYKLQGTDWEKHEERVHEAYWRGDLKTLISILTRRENFALRRFAEFKGDQAT